MSSERHAPAAKLVVITTLVLFMIAQCPGVFSSEAAAAGRRSERVAKAKTAFEHKALKHFVAGHRIHVEATITDPRKITLARLYFRAAGQENFMFVAMTEGKKNTFSGILPAPSAETSGIDYLILTVNGYNQVVKTQVFKTERRDSRRIPDWQKVSEAGQLVVSTELAEAKAPEGFTDSITSDVVESALRFGYVAGLYSMAEMAAAGGTAGVAGGTTGAAAGGGAGATAGGTTGGAASATSSGTASASTGGVSAGAVVGVTAAVVAVGAAAVVIVDALSCPSGGGTCGGGGSVRCSGYMTGGLDCCDIDACAYTGGGGGYYRSSDGEYFCFSSNSSSVNAAARAVVDHCQR